MKKLSVVMLTLLVLLSAQGIKANDPDFDKLISPGTSHEIPEAVLYSLVQKYRGYKLINTNRVGSEYTESYRAILVGGGSLLEVALSPDGGVQGEILLTGYPDSYRDNQKEIVLDKKFRQFLLADGFNKKEYRRNVNHLYESNRYNNGYYSGFGYPYYGYYRYPYRYYSPRHYRFYRRH